MKYFFMLVAFIVFGSRTVNSQDLTGSDFYRMFQSKIIIHNYSSYKDKVALHSIRLKADAKGLITNVEVSASADSTLRKDIIEAISLIDKQHLRITNYKNVTMILPLIMLNGTQKPVDERMWVYGSEGKDLINGIKLLPPLVIFMDFSRMIDN